MSNCNCSDADACEALPPVLQGSKVVVLNTANCQRSLVGVPGGVLYNDGTNVYYADGGSSRPLALPGLSEMEGSDGTTVGKLLFQTNGGVIGGLTADASTDGLYVRSMAGSWEVAPLPVTTSWPVADIPTECCCPEAFAVLVLNGDGTEYELRRFNPCEDATSVNEGPLLTCEEGCMRRLNGTSDDQVLVWDNSGEIWVPTEISSLIPTPESVLDVSRVEWSGTDLTLPAGADVWDQVLGTNSAWNITQSGTLVSSASYASPYTHNTLQITNAGWHKFDFTVSGALQASSVATDPRTGMLFGFLTVNVNNSAVTPNPFARVPISVAAVSDGGGGFDVWFTFEASISYAANFAANDKVDLNFTTLFSTNFAGGVDGGSYPTALYDPTTARNWTIQATGTVTRIT